MKKAKQNKGKALLRAKSTAQDLILGEFKIRQVLPLVDDYTGLFNSISFIRPNTAKTDELISQGFVATHSTIWTSKFNNQLLADTVRGLRTPIYGDTQVFIECRYVPRTSLLTSRVGLWIDENNGNRMNSSDFGQVIRGNVVLMVLYLREIDGPDFNPDAQASRIINRLRLVAGGGIAIDKCLSTTFNLFTQQAYVVNRVRRAMPEHEAEGIDGPTLSQHIQGTMLDVQLKAEAEVLYVAALEAEESWKRFLFLWLMFEAQTSSDGSKRKHYILNTLGSERVNAEALRLRTIRADIAHGRKATVLLNDIHSIMGLIRLTCINFQPSLEEAVKAYEIWLES